MFTADQSECGTDSNAIFSSDDAARFLHGEVKRALGSKGYHGLGDVEISIDQGVVYLRGLVHSYHVKQVAQTAASVIPGVREVRNELNVGGSR